MATSKSSTRRRKPAPARCDGHTFYGHTKCDAPDWVKLPGHSPLWGQFKCQKCGGIVCWGGD